MTLERPAASTDILAGRWRPKWLLVCFAAAALLMGSWVWPPILALWDSLDLAVFRALNDTVGEPGGWQTFWAIANHRAFDLVPFAITLWFVMGFVFAEERRHAVERSAQLLAFVLFILAVRKVIGLDALELGRESPTRVLDDTNRLTRLVPWIDGKDSSGECFPGDHCAFLLMLVAFFWLHAGRRLGLAFVAMTALFSMPRLVAGAHWLTDDVVGSAVVALVAISVFQATPLHAVLRRWIEPLTRRGLRRWLPADRLASEGAAQA